MIVSSPYVSRFWRHLPLTSKGLATVGLPVTILVIGLSLFSVRALEEQTNRQNLQQTIRVRMTLGTLLRHLLILESTARASFVSSSSHLSQPYLEARKQIAADLAKLDSQTQKDNKNGSRLVALHASVHEKLDTAAGLLAAAGSGVTANDSTAFTLLGRSMAAMQRVKNDADAIDAEEEHRQWSDLAALDQAHDRTVAIGTITIALGLISTVGSTVFFARSIARRLKDLQVSARALKIEAPLAAEDQSDDEIGQLKSELERTSESLVGRARELRASEQQMRAIVDQTTAIVYVKDLESRYLLVNKAYERAFGIKAREVIGRSSVELYGAKLGAQLEENDRMVIETKRPDQFEESILVKGRLYSYISVKAPLFSSLGEVYGVCGINTDVTGQLWRRGDSFQEPIVNDEPSLGRAPDLSVEQMEVIEQLARGAAHELNNILTTIIGDSTNLIALTAEPDRSDSAAGRILGASQRAASLAKQLLTLSGSLLDRVRVLEVEQVLAELTQELRSVLDRSITLKVEPAEAVRIKADPAQIQQALLHLCLNARDAMVGGGTLTISASSAMLDNENTGVGTEFVAIAVHDEGPGIAPELQAQMYEPFFSTKKINDGNGLGLTIASMSAQQNGGWLQCKSEIGTGTTFTLFLPAAAETVADAPDKAKDKVLLGQHETVLLVEDEPAVGELVALLLRTLGYTVLRAHSGEEGQRVIDTTEKLDLVLTDLQLGSMTGLELIERNERQHPRLKFILTSGSAMDSSGGTSHRATLQKPFELKELAAKVRSVLEREDLRL